MELVGEWTFTTVEVTKHKVTYDWTGNIPEGKDLPKEITDLVKGQPYDVDSNFSSATVVEVKDAYGNVNGRYTFSGWKLNDCSTNAVISLHTLFSVSSSWS